MEENNTVSNKKKKIIIISSILVFFVIAITITTYSVLLKMEKNNAEQSVIEVLDKLKSSDNDLKEKYFKFDNNENEENDSFNIIKNSEYYDSIVSNLEYNIISSKVNFKNATIIVEISNKNIGIAFSNYLSKVFELSIQSSFSEEYLEENVEEELKDYWITQITSTDTKIEKNIIKLELIKENGKWIIIDENITEFVNAIFPGLAEAINNKVLEDEKEYAVNEAEDSNDVDTNTVNNSTIKNSKIEKNVNNTKKNNVTSSHTHQYTSTITRKATCTIRQLTTYTCSSCGDSYIEEGGLDNNNHPSMTPSTMTCTACGRKIQSNSSVVSSNKISPSTVVPTETPSSTAPTPNAPTGGSDVSAITPTPEPTPEPTPTPAPAPEPEPIDPATCPHKTKHTVSINIGGILYEKVTCGDCGTPLN